MERMKLPRSGGQCFDAECMRLESALTASDRGLVVKLSVVNLNICFVIRVTILSVRAASQNNTILVRGELARDRRRGDKETYNSGHAPQLHSEISTQMGC